MSGQARRYSTAQRLKSRPISEIPKPNYKNPKPNYKNKKL